MHQYMLWYKRRCMRCVFLHYATTSLFKQPTEHTADMQFSNFQHLRAVSTSVRYIQSYLLSPYRCSRSLSQRRHIQVRCLIVFSFFLVLNVGQSVDVRTRVREFCSGEMSHRIFHRYVPRGPQTNTSSGAGKPGGGPIKQPNGGSNGGGQTNTSAGGRWA